jgi:hypothetical protein
MRARAILLSTLMIGLSILACGPSEVIDSVATSVAATMAAMGGETPLETAPPAAESPEPAPTEAPCVMAASLTIAYTNGGNVWFIEGTNPPIQLTSGGNADDVSISDDGQRVAFTTYDNMTGNTELRVVHSDGTGETVLLSQAQLDALYPLGDALHNLLHRRAFMPCTHNLLFNTRATFEGPGLATHDNVLLIDVDSATLTTLLNPGDGGDFTVSPDHAQIAISRPDSISLVNADGTNLRPDLLTITPVITYSEYMWSPYLRWAPGSAAVGLAMPSEDPFAPGISGTIWRIPADGSPPVALATIAGEFFFTQTRYTAISPDFAKVAFERDTATPNIMELYIANVDGTGETLYDTGNISWWNWNPDSTNFVYRTDTGDLRLGRLGAGPMTLGNGTNLRWVNTTRYLYLTGSYGSWTLKLGTLGGADTTLASPAGDFVAYDFAPKP